MPLHAPVREMAALRSAASTATASARSTVGRALGRGPTPLAQALEPARKLLRNVERQDGDLRKYAGLAEEALAALQKAHAKTPDDTQLVGVAGLVRRGVVVALNDAGQALSSVGRQRDPQALRLQRVHEAATLVLDHHRVAASEREHLDQYLKEGETAERGLFSKLQEKGGFAPVPDRPDTSGLDAAVRTKPDLEGFTTYDSAFLHFTGDRAGDPDLAHRALAALYNLDSSAFEKLMSRRRAKYGAAQGLHPAETAAVTTYTGQDYRYMNPARAGSGEWMKAITGGKDTQAAKVEGAGHAAVAERGLRQLPPYRGTVFRAEGFGWDRFEELFEVRGDKVVPRVRTKSWPHVVSTSRARSVSQAFFSTISDPHQALFELRVQDARDVGQMSVNAHEVEVLLLPGTTVAIDSVEVTRTGKPGIFKDPLDDRTAYTLFVRAHQVRA